MIKKQAGFALVLSLVLLLVMSLMGGALIVIVSADHSKNTSNDRYMQTFYVAETALLEGERYIVNKFKGDWLNGAIRDSQKRGRGRRRVVPRVRRLRFGDARGARGQGGW